MAECEFLRQYISPCGILPKQKFNDFDILEFVWRTAFQHRYLCTIFHCTQLIYHIYVTIDQLTQVSKGSQILIFRCFDARENFR